MRKSFLLCCLASLLSYPSYAQDTLRYRHRLSLMIGPGKLISQDEVISPLRYRGTATMIRSGYQFLGNKHRHTAMVSVLTPALETKVNIVDGRHGPTYAILAQFNYSYQRLAYHRTGLSLWAGGKIGLTGLYKDPEAINPHSASDAVWSLGPTMNLEYVLPGSHHLSWRLSYPLLSNVVGRSYGFAFGDVPLSSNLAFSDVVQQNTWFAPHQLVDLQSTLAYEYAFGARWSFRTTYEFRYWQYRRPLLIQSALHAWQLGFIFGL